MRRPERNSARVLALAIAGALLFVVGYFAGSRYARPPLEGIRAVVLETPPQLSTPADVDLLQGWRLLAVGRFNAPACREVLTHMVQIHNRLAVRPDVQGALQLVFLTPATGRETGDAVEAPRVLVVRADAARGIARQLGQPPGSVLDCREAALGLLDPNDRLRALMPVDVDAATTASDLTRLLDHLQAEHPS